MIKNYKMFNEGINKYLKGPSEEEIKNNINLMDNPDKMLELSINIDYVDGVNKAINKGADFVSDKETFKKVKELTNITDEDMKYYINKLEPSKMLKSSIIIGYSDGIKKAIKNGANFYNKFDFNAITELTDITDEELESIFKKLKPTQILDNAMKIGSFNNVVLAFKENKNPLLYGSDRINTHYIKFEYINNFNEEEQKYIIDKYLENNNLFSLLEKCVKYNCVFGVKYTFNPDLSDEPGIKERQLDRLKDLQEYKDSYIKDNLLQAVQNNNTEIVKILIDNASDKLVIPTECINGACMLGYFEIVKLLVEKGVDIHQQDGEYPLNYAVREGHFEIVKYLVEHGANIHARNNHPLHDAALKGYFDIVKYLVSKGADIHSNGEYALSISAYEGFYEQTKWLLEQGADVNKLKPFFIDGALEKGTTQMKTLLKKYIKND